MRLIDADALEEWIYIDECEYNNKYDIEAVEWESIENAPTIDAEPIRHGKWIVTEAYPHNIYCSECKKTYAQTHWAVWNDEEKPLPRNYCPNCGAKMDKE